MRLFTAHTRLHTAPILVREGFCWGAAIFGPLWFALRRSWVLAALALLAAVAAAATHGRWPLLLGLALGWVQGLFGHDLVRWSLARRGFLLAHVVAGRDGDEALARLLGRRPDLIEAAVTETGLR